MAIMLYAGCMHFLATDTFTQVVPPALPDKALLVQLSGAAEIALALGLAICRLRRLAAWGLVALYIAVFPANVYMAIDDVAVNGVRYGWITWARLPLQALLIAWAWWYTRPDDVDGMSASEGGRTRTPRPGPEGPG
jgi:uncharacterized membrane protein